MAASPNNMWTPTYFPGPTSSHDIPPLRWWYAWTTPTPLVNSSGFRVQEAIRQARFISAIVLIELIALIILVSVDFFYSQYALAVYHCLSFALLCLPLWFNRQRHKREASWTLVWLTEAIIFFSLLLESYTWKSGVVGLFGIYFLLLPQILAALLLNMHTTLLMLILNCLMSAFSGMFLYSSIHIDAIVHYAILTSTCLLFAMIFLFTWLWRRNVADIMAHADGIEVVAALEHAMAAQEHSVAQSKRTLDQSVDKLMQAHLHIANGEYDVRVAINEGDALWPIAGSLNTLLARIQRLARDSKKLEKTEQEAAQLAAVLRAMRTGGASVPFRRSGTAIDLITIELATDVYSHTDEEKL